MVTDLKLRDVRFIVSFLGITILLEEVFALLCLEKSVRSLAWS
jgi:hypothetical protein